MGKKFTKLNQMQIALINAFLDLCKTSTDPIIVAGEAALVSALDDAEDKSDATDEPPGDVP